MIGLIVRMRACCLCLLILQIIALNELCNINNTIELGPFLVRVIRAKLVNKTLTNYVNRWFIAALARDHYWCWAWANWSHSESFSICDPFHYYSTMSSVSIVVSPGSPTIILSAFLMFNILRTGDADLRF